MNTVNPAIVDVIPRRKVETKSGLLSTLNLKARVQKYKFNKTWYFRNEESAEVLLESLELDSIEFQHNIFVEETVELVTKLERIGFEELSDFPDKKTFAKFSKMYYNGKHNVALSLYKPELKDIVQTAYDITLEAQFIGETGYHSFVSTINVLMNKNVKSSSVRSK